MKLKNSTRQSSRLERSSRHVDSLDNMVERVDSLDNSMEHEASSISLVGRLHSSIKSEEQMEC